MSQRAMVIHWILKTLSQGFFGNKHNANIYLLGGSKQKVNKPFF